jgi:hypothetical protein
VEDPRPGPEAMWSKKRPAFLIAYFSTTPARFQTLYF